MRGRDAAAQPEPGLAAVRPPRSRSRAVSPAARSGVPGRPAASGLPRGFSAVSMPGPLTEARLAGPGSGPSCRPVSQASRWRLYSWPAAAKPAERQSPGPAASAYSNVWLQCCQAKLLPSGTVRWSPSIHTPDGQALHERISAMCSVPSGLTRLLGVPRLSSATVREASGGSGSSPAEATGVTSITESARSAASRPGRRGQVRARDQQHRQVPGPADVGAGARTRRRGTAAAGSHSATGPPAASWRRPPRPRPGPHPSSSRAVHGFSSGVPSAIRTSGRFESRSMAPYRGPSGQLQVAVTPCPARAATRRVIAPRVPPPQAAR